MPNVDIERLERALRAADAAGDDESARALANEIRKRLASENQSDLSAVTRFGAGSSAGIAKTVGAPVDLVNAMLSAFGLGTEEPFGGSRHIQRMMSSARMTVPPGEEESLGRAGRVGEVVGASAVGAAGVVGAGARSATAAATGARGAQSVAGRVAQDVAETAISRPGTFVTGETAAAVGAGLAGFEAARRFPDSPGAQAIAEIAGGLAPAGALMATKGAVRTTVGAASKLPLLGPMVARHARNVISGLTLKGGRRRAEDRVRRATEDPESAAARLERKDVLPGLSPAQLTGEEGLLALERDVMEAVPELSMARQRQFADVNRTIRSSLDTPAREVPAHQVREYFQGLLDTRLSIAAQRAEERIAELGTRATREDLNRIAREELLRARTAARGQESQLYQAIPPEASVPTLAVQNRFQELWLRLPRAQRGDMPPVAKRLLDVGSEDSPNPGFLGDETTIEELRGLQSKLREEARIAGAAGKNNRARIAGDLADAINEDIANAIGGPEVRDAVDAAVSFSRDLNQRFTQGAVGRLLGTERVGGSSVPEGLTLEVTVGQRGPRAREATDALLEAVRRNGDEEAMRQHISEFLIDDFRRAAVSGGRVDVNAANRYLAENQDILARFPETRRLIERARGSEEALAEVERLADPKVSRAAVFIHAPPGQEIDRVIATSRPKDAMQELMEMAGQDPTGKAAEGVKAAFLERLLRRSELSNSLDVNDTPFISGQRMSRELEDPQVLSAMEGLFTKDELKRIERIRQTAILLDKARTVKSSAEGVIGDAPGVVTSMLGRILSAQMGRVIAGKTGGGTVQTPGIMSSQAQKLLRAGVQDPARRLLNDAIQDESLFRALLLPTNTIERERAVRARLNSWVTDVLTEQYEIEDESD